MKIAVTTDNHLGHSPLSLPLIHEMLLKIKEQNPTVFINAGDFCSTSVLERYIYWKLVRETLGDSVLLTTVLGNHDLWDRREFVTHPSFASLQEPIPDLFKKAHSPEDCINSNKLIFNKFGVSYLPETTEVLSRPNGSKVILTGFNGWYKNPVHTNDMKYIPHYNLPEGRPYLLNLAYTEFCDCLKEVSDLKNEGDKAILVSHFGIVSGAHDWKNGMDDREYYGGNDRWESEISSFDYYFFGHSHIEFDKRIHPNTQAINVGGGYDNPKFRMIEL